MGSFLVFTLGLIASMALLGLLTYCFEKWVGTTIAILTMILFSPLSCYSGMIVSNKFVNNYSDEEVFLKYISDFCNEEGEASISCASNNNQFYACVFLYKVEVELRTDNQNYTSVRFGSRNLFIFGGTQQYDSATILAPTQEDVQKWQNWMQLHITTYEHEQQKKYKPERIVPRG